jgi:hypothetical protein
MSNDPRLNAIRAVMALMPMGQGQRGAGGRESGDRRRRTETLPIAKPRRKRNRKSKGRGAYLKNLRWFIQSGADGLKIRRTTRIVHKTITVENQILDRK